MSLFKTKMQNFKSYRRCHGGPEPLNLHFPNGVVNLCNPASREFRNPLFILQSVRHNEVERPKSANQVADYQSWLARSLISALGLFRGKMAVENFTDGTCMPSRIGACD